MLSIFLVGVSLGISVGIAFINRETINIGVSIGISIVVTVVNIGIQMMIAYTSLYENEYIASREQSSIAIKIGVAQLVNSIGVPIIVTLISQANTSMQRKSWVGAGGLVDDVFFIAALNTLVPIAILFDPWEIYLKFWRWWYSRPLKRLELHGQEQLNKHYGNYVFDIGYEYAYLIKTAIFTSFFVCMQPIIAAFAPVGLLIYYLASKRNLLYHFQRPNFHFSNINDNVDFMLLFSLLAYGFGCLMVNNFIREEISFLENGTLLTNWIIVMIAAGFIIIVPLKIFHFCIKKKEPKKYIFESVNAALISDYDRLNPETKSAAVAEFNELFQGGNDLRGTEMNKLVALNVMGYMEKKQV